MKNTEKREFHVGIGLNADSLGLTQPGVSSSSPMRIKLIFGVPPLRGAAGPWSVDSAVSACVPAAGLPASDWLIRTQPVPDSAWRSPTLRQPWPRTGRLSRFSRPFGDHEPGISPRYKTRCLNKSNFARPYICLLINFRRFTWPSVWPLLHINEQPFRTAARSFFTLTAKW